MPELERFTEHLINELKTKGISPEVVENAFSKLKAENYRLRCTLDGDPSQLATPEERRAWRASAVRYADGLEDRVEQLQGALIALYDEQNGPPLLKREKQWGEAMDMVRKVITHNTEKGNENNNSKT